MWYICNNRGGGIDNTQTVTEIGKYSLDAYQNNPSKEGTLRSEVNKTKEQTTSLQQGLNNVTAKVDSRIVNAWNNFQTTNHIGYIHLARIKIMTINIDYPIKFAVNGRGFLEPASLIVLFNNSSNPDPDINIQYCICKTKFNPNYNYHYKFYIVKEATNTWNIYVSHPAWTNVAVIQAEVFRFKDSVIFDITYPNTLVDTLPNGALEFTQAT